MGATRTEPDNAKFQARQRYYRKHRQEILARAKTLYSQDRELRREIAKKVRDEVKQERLQQQAKSKGLFGQWIQRFKSRVGGSATGD